MDTYFVLIKIFKDSNTEIIINTFSNKKECINAVSEHIFNTNSDILNINYRFKIVECKNDTTTLSFPSNNFFFIKDDDISKIIESKFQYKTQQEQSENIEILS